MQKINKGNPPAFFSDFIKKSKPKDWNDIAPIREVRYFLGKKGLQDVFILFCMSCSYFAKYSVFSQ